MRNDERRKKVVVLVAASAGAFVLGYGMLAFERANATVGELLPSEEWEMPPVDMHSIGTLPNGIMFGASKNDLCLSEPNKPYAWPSRYRQPADFQIVGANSFGTTIVAATEGTPAIMRDRTRSRVWLLLFGGTFVDEGGRQP